MHKEPIIRDARSEDVDALVALRYSKTIHLDRLQDADGKHLRYLIVEYKGQIIGFGLLVFIKPPGWPNIGGRLPQMIDLFIRDDFRSRGIGTLFIHRMEEIAFECGYRDIYVTVEPENNKRAYDLYLRLGYEPLQTEPREDHWKFTDSDGKIHEGVEWVIDMKKLLKSTKP